MARLFPQRKLFFIRNDMAYWAANIAVSDDGAVFNREMLFPEADFNRF